VSSHGVVMASRLISSHLVSSHERAPGPRRRGRHGVPREERHVPEDGQAGDDVIIASPRLASPRRAAPRLASPRLASPRLASPRLASPRLASPRLASPRLASPRLASPPRCLPQRLLVFEKHHNRSSVMNSYVSKVRAPLSLASFLLRTREGRRVR
jgi:hypothetical protein